MTWLPINSPSHRCFGCGSDNPYGLKMRFETDGEKVRTRIAIPEHLRGWSNLAHGGVISTIMDEAMGWAGIYFTNKFLLTRDLSVTYHKPVFIGMTVTATGWIEEKKNARKVLICGEMRDEQGELLATSTSEFALFNEQQFDRMQLIPSEELGSMATMFSSAHDYGHDSEFN